jgi:hypothetical protein
MKQRKQIIEHPFGTMKRSMNQGYFLLRGLPKVRTEMTLTVLAYNLKRVLNLVGVERLLEVVIERRKDTLVLTLRVPCYSKDGFGSYKAHPIWEFSHSLARHPTIDYQYNLQEP